MPQIVREDLDQLNISLTVTIERQEIQADLDKELEEVKKKAQLKGFRQGKVPMSVVKKMFGHSVVSDKVGKLVQESMSNFLKENKINYILDPLPSEDFEVPEMNLNTDSFLFKFDLALAQIDTVKGLESDYTSYEVEIDEAAIEQNFGNFRKWLGTTELTEEPIALNDLVKLLARELDDDGTTLKTDGHSSEFSIRMDDLTSKGVEALLGKKPGDTLALNVFELEEGMEEEKVKKYFLNLPADWQGKMNPVFECTVIEVKRTILAELNEAFFERLFPNEGITTEDAAKELLRNREKERMAELNSILLRRDIQDRLKELNHPELPSAFVKRWIQSKGIEEGKVEEEMKKIEDDLAWSVVFSHLIHKYNVSVLDDDILKEVGADLEQYSRYNSQHLDEESMRSLAGSWLSNEKYVRQKVGEVQAGKLFDELERIVKVSPEKISSKDFLELYKERTKN